MSDFPLESPQERLSWIQKLTGFDDGKTDDAGLEIDPALSFPWPDDPDERIWAPVYMSLNEYTALLSSVDVGAAIAWTNDALLVYYILVRNYSGGSMQFCEKVADCFTNDPEFRQSVIDALKADQNFIDAVQDLSGRSSGRQIEGELFTGDCDESVVAGRVMAIIDRLNSRNADFLEIVEVGTNDEERVSSVLAAIPGLGESPVDEIIDIVQTFLEDFTENYAAAITDDWLEEVYFDIWCATLERPDCTLTFQDLFDYFNGRVGADLSVTSTIQNIFSFIVNGDFSTKDLVASGMYLIQLSYILAGLEFNGMSVPTIGALARDAEPSSAWLDWPECGPTPPSDLWVITTCIGETRYGIVDKVSGPASGPGTYEFTFTGVQFDPPTSIFIGGFRWGNEGEQFVVNSISANVTFPADGTGYYFPPASDADCGYEPGLVATLPVADSTTPYGGIKANTYNTAPWVITMNITVSTI